MSKDLDTTLGGPSTSKSGETNHLLATPLRFHRVHDTMELSTDKLTARLVETAVCGAVFSDRPVRVNEKVCLRFNEFGINMNSGCSISCGFITTDPATLSKSTPSILNPMSPGYSIEWLKNLHYEQDKIIYFYYNEKGEIHYGIKGEEQRTITPKTNTNYPLWAAIQLFGGLREVQFADPGTLDVVPSRNQVRDGVRRPNKKQVKGGVGHRNQNQLKDCETPQNQVKVGDDRPNHHQVKDGVRHPNHSQVKNDLLANIIRSLSIEQPLPSSSNHKRLVPLNLHRIKGRNINFCNYGILGKREGAYSHSYAFSAQPVSLGQTIIIQIIAAEAINRGTLDIGFTSWNPSDLNGLPNNLMELFDRQGYCEIHRHAENILEVGDELGLTLSQEGKMVVTKNNCPDPVQTINLIQTVNLRAFFDIWGKITKVRLLISDVEKKNKKKRNYNLKEKAVLPTKAGGIKENAVLPTKTGGIKGAVLSSKAGRITDVSLTKAKGIKDAVLPTKTAAIKDNAVLPSHSVSECTICLENPIDCVIYKCGHMCLCYNCAMTQWKGKGSAFGKCPLCRGLITDVIRTYMP